MEPMRLSHESLRLTTQDVALNHCRKLALLLFIVKPLFAQAPTHPSFTLQTHRMDVDVDGAPNAYGPAGTHPLDIPRDAHYRGRKHAQIVGYLTDDDNPNLPVLQGPNDPFPGYYISQTAFTDPARTNPADPLRYVDATRINYVVLGNAAKRRGARVGDFVAAYSRTTHKSAFGIIADSGNPSGDEGSLHLLQALGYPFHNGIDDAVEDPEILIRFYPHSNPATPGHPPLFFRTQAALDAAATKLGLSRDFTTPSASK
jgi:hypothetical protein